MSKVVARGVSEFRRRALVGLIAGAPTVKGDALIAWAGQAPVREVFEDATDLLRALQEHWTDLLTREVYGAPHYPLGADGMKALYTNLAGAYPSLRVILDDHREDPEIADQLLDEHVLLARAAGNLDTRASASSLAWRARDLLATIPAQRDRSLVGATFEE